MSAFRVSICVHSGGGIGGLSLALVIGKYGQIPVDIFEAGPEITTVGAGISCFGRTMDIMKELGLYDELIDLAIHPPQDETGPNFRKSDQHDGYYWFQRKLKRGPLSLHRKDLIDLLFRHLPASCNVQTSKRLTSYTTNGQTQSITLRFSDGTIAQTDVLIGADGIHSVTRKTMYQALASDCQESEVEKKLLDCIEPVWTGTLLYRNLVPMEKLLQKFPDVQAPTELTLHLGKGKHIVSYPISQGRLLNVLVINQDYDSFGTPFEGRWVVDVPAKEILDQYEDWEPRARALVKCFENPSRWALHTLRPLPFYTHDRVALIGDAAHATEPHFGAGAGQAIEDAFILGRLLTHELTHRDNVAQAMKTYEEVRLPFANGIVERSEHIGRLYCFYGVSDDRFVSPRETEVLNHVKRSIEDAWEWQNGSDWAWDKAERLWRTNAASIN
ncbi:hypothetical protein F5I97DRAFT_2069891 [Phlebopus sp. FC_14]|nr:hypothetical protein F5I97DRAFT_2069891 [Phlebopus sp. FC_14]